MAVGLLLAFVSLLTVAPVPSPATNAPVAQEQGTDREADADKLQAFEAITSPINFSLTQDFFLIEVLPELKESDQSLPDETQAAPTVSKVLKVLFRRIISPNAP